MAAMIRLLYFSLVISIGIINIVSSVTNPQDAAVLLSLRDGWQNSPPSWNSSDDPCGAFWVGVTCTNSRVTALSLSTMGLIGNLSSDIGGLGELNSLDLSFNTGLSGSLPPQLGDLTKLSILILAGCDFTGTIPSELGNLEKLIFLALNSNSLTGEIPASLGKLSNLYWLDLANNQLTGSLPVSSLSSPGLELLKKAKHFHFNHNQLSGVIPSNLFSSDMVLIHIVFDGNRFEGNIPDTLGLVQTLEVLRLNHNALSGSVPRNLRNLTNLAELNLAQNLLSGALPDLNGLNSLNYVDLSYNSFDQSEAPSWFSSLQSLTTLVMESGSLEGSLPPEIFSLPQIQQVILRNNGFNNTLDIGDTVSQFLQLVDLENNNISALELASSYNNTLMWIHVIYAQTNPQDAAVLRSLKDQWGNTPPSWDKSDDPCAWEGVACNNSRVTSLGLSTMGLTGKMGGDIGGLSELISLDLSFNPGLTGPLSPRLADLQKLTILILAGCSFTNNIPSELGNLEELTFLALNSNNLTGDIPPSLGKLSKLYWLDLAENQLKGNLPVSSLVGPGLDQLKKAKHFHFNKNQLSGEIPSQLFDSDMSLIHVLFDGNQLEGSIPSTVGLVQALEVLNLAHNMLSGALPNLTGMNSLNYVDLSNNSFKKSTAPDWFSTLQSLTTLVIEYGPLEGSVPSAVFSLPQIEQVKLKNNAFGDILDMSRNISQQLQLIDLENNDISSVTIGSEYKSTLLLIGNPVCSATLENSVYCQIQQSAKPYSTSLANCGSQICTSDKKLNPQSCDCAYPYEGTLYFRAPSFRDLSNASLFHSLEMSLWVKLGLSPGSVSLQNLFFNVDDYLQVHLGLFPSDAKYFNRSEVQRIGFYLSNQTYKPPSEFGPYYFIASPYIFGDENVRAHIGRGMIAGITTGCAFLVVMLAGLGTYAIRQKKRAEQAISLSKPFASWAPSGKDSGGAPQLKGARWFSYDELKKCTNNFSDSNQIGSGGYGKVYRGMLSGGQVLAIKRAQQGSTQGGQEFKNEIELLSRVHHKNLVGLVGFCFEQGEQMLVYEFMANGTLRESLTGKSGIHLDWKRRIRIALGSARGLAYLHELAHPPIIHRDVKSTNILLDDNLTAKVADFGLCKLVSDSSKGHVSTQVKGTLGYLDPEYYMTQQLTEKSDVYSFGVVMLELITARQPIEKGKYIVREVRIVMDKSDEKHYGLREIMDPTIRNTPNLIGFQRFLELAMQCVEESASDRPTMSEVVKNLENILQNDGVSTNSTSASSSATEFGSSTGALRHPYNDSLPRKDATESDAFDYSGGYTIPAKVEPK
ncbi:hypothetical protein BUALT_Bualt01G0110900 [Buddleja alternifolia]|uniref:non-specific serine/threonine protein kinase n=1 Tax=Buddleja alternifolia TaxID=168488 RepID=A0AAV6Y686_9LAMI|nr:hypothetical protein BUALT_Bualt01G0110900 [Buddleja alternifolia]